MVAFKRKTAEFPVFFSPWTFNYSCPTSENKGELKIQRPKRSTGTVACRKIKGISWSPSAGNTDTGTLSNRKGSWAAENRHVDWSVQSGHCQQCKQLKRRQESINGFVTVHRDPQQETPGVQQLYLPTQRYGSTGTLQIGSQGRLMAQGVLVPSEQRSQTACAKQAGDIQHRGLELGCPARTQPD